MFAVSVGRGFVLSVWGGVVRIAGGKFVRIVLFCVWVVRGIFVGRMLGRIVCLERSGVFCV